MTRLRGRAPRGKRLHAVAPCGHWQSTTMISSIRLDGTTACMQLPGAADIAVFVTYIEEVLCPTLRQGDIVVMDNLAVHKSPQVAALVQAAGAEVRFLPAYCLLDFEDKSQAISAALRFTRPQYDRENVEQNHSFTAQQRSAHTRGTRPSHQPRVLKSHSQRCSRLLCLFQL